MNDTPETTAQPEVTPTAAVQTQSTAVNVDIEQLVTQAATKAAELEEKKNESVFKSMLQQSGLDDAAIQSMLAEYKAKQVTPEQTIKQLQDELSTERGKNAAYEQKKILHEHGLSEDTAEGAEEMARYHARLIQLVTDGKDFATAAQEYFTANPRPTKAPATVVPGVTGGTPLTQSEQETMRAAYQKAAKDGDRATMSSLTRQAKEKNITLY